MEFRTFSSPHLPVPGNVPVLMQRVLLALLPGIACLTWYFGWGILINILLACLTSAVAEAAMLRARGRPPVATLRDGSAMVTGVLLALALPPLTPWWMPVIGSLFGIVVAKQLYGGLGYNPFNPAMAGYVMLLISFPLELTLWPPASDYPSLAQTLALVFTDTLPAGSSIDALTAATPLDSVKTRLGLNETISEIRADGQFGLLGGHGWEWINLWFLTGGLALLWLRVIPWQIPAGLLGSLFLVSLAFYLASPDNYTPPDFQLFSGSAMLAAFFIATDPVSASTTPRGRLLFGAGIGLLIYVIRTWGGYPDGVAFAVLLMNMAAPTIDHYTQPRVYGHDKQQ